MVSQNKTFSTQCILMVEMDPVVILFSLCMRKES